MDAPSDTSYMGNRNLKPQHIDIPFTEELVKEYEKCMDDPVYFIKTYIKIVSLDEGLIYFNLRDYQEKMVHALVNHRNTVFCLPRQVGKTVTVGAFAIHQALFKDKYSILIAANKARTAIEIMKRIRESYQYLPKWLQQGVTKWNGGTIEFENGSRIMAIPTTDDAARGFTHNLIILDEFAFLPRNIADEFYTSVIPTISTGKTSKIAILSTPKGLNHFWDLWDESTKIQQRIDNGELIESESTEGRYYPIEIKWNDVPGRDEVFKQKMLDSFHGDYNRWLQEFEASFIGTSSTLVNPTTVRRLKEIRQLPISEFDNGINIYKNPEPGHTYFICLDTAEGKGLDYHAATVVDITKNPLEVVATYHDNRTPTEIVPHVVMNLGKMYNEAYILVETRSLGSMVAYTLFNELEYGNMLAAEPRGRNGLTLTVFNDKNRGLPTSVASRSIGCDRLKVLLETEQLIVTDKTIIDEIANFILLKGKYQADIGHNDDLVMTLVMLAWATTTPFFKDLSNVDVKDAFKDRLQAIQEDFVPFGVILGSEEDFDPLPIDW